jgi:hypothetical protein
MNNDYFLKHNRGEIQDLFEKAAKTELERGVISGDQSKQKHMSHLLAALPYHKKEIAVLEKLSKVKVTTEVPKTQPEVPKDLKKLLKQYGLLDKNGNPVEIAPLPLAVVANDPKSTLYFNDDEKSKHFDQEKVKKQQFLIKAEDYEAFKPLKVKKPINEAAQPQHEVDVIFKQFGLNDHNQNSSKKGETEYKISSKNEASYLLASYSSLLENIGIETSNKNLKGYRNRMNYTSSNDLKNLQNLLENIKELEKLNKTLSLKEVEKLNLENYNFSDALLKSGPDPTIYLSNYSALKNEVKRRQIGSGSGQEPLLESSLEENIDDNSKTDVTTENSLTSSSTTKELLTTKMLTTTEASRIESSTQEKKNTLEDEIETIDDPEPLPPPRRSGFYMLVDWNSFFEVGEDDKIKVRFDPKIGDPSRFLPVNIP